MDLLKELSLRGKMVFVVIHQPSSDIFKMFDTLIILDSGGFQIYYGNPVEAVLYFRDIINATNKNQGACPECGKINPEQVFDIIETKIVNEYGRLTDSRKISPGQWYQYFKQRIKIPRVQHVQEKLPVEQKIPNTFKQLRVFIERDVLSKISNKQYLFINLFESPLLALFIAFMVKYYNVLATETPAYTFYENENIPVYFFMSVVVALFFGLTMSAEEIFRDKKILKREQYLQLSKGSYLISKVMVMFMISAFQTLAFVVVGNLVLEIPLTELRYWFILFTCSCFANMVGLNISASFNSAVTIYILIPILIIPQLLLSGVVISFDKFNPKVSKPIGVPLIGEVMASRWAFEAFMVTQFRDNPYEKIFYDLEKANALSDYKRIYYIPTLESKLAYVFNTRQHWNNNRAEEMVSSLSLLQNEIRNELRTVGEENFPDIDKLAIGKFDSTVYNSTNHFLAVLKQYYINKSAKALEEKEKLVAGFTKTPVETAEFENFRKKYVNKAVTTAVENTNIADRIVEFDGKLVQRIYPIFMDEHKPKHALDFSANFYQPTKHFLGRIYDTFYFNLCVIWVMTLILYITLYFDVLPNLIQAAFGRHRFRRKGVKV
jgi:hypothetical protein